MYKIDPSAISNVSNIGRVIFKNSQPAKITSIIDSSDSVGRTTTVRTEAGDIFVRIRSIAGDQYYKMDSGALFNEPRIKSFDLE